MRTLILPAAIALAALVGTAPVLAEKPDHAGGKHAHKQERKADKHDRKSDKHERKADRKGERGDDRHASGDAPRRGAYFDDTHRESARRYYTSYSGPNCPPGLAKKNNGCMPPGQAKKWQVGHRVPHGVTLYEVPQPILVNLPPPPPRHRYVRVAGDILLVAIGTQMVVDGMSGLLN